MLTEKDENCEFLGGNVKVCIKEVSAWYMR